MLTPFRVEIYNRDFEMVAWGQCQAPGYRFDYLTLEEWQVVALGELTAKRGSYIQVVQGNKVKYQGVLTSYDNASEQGKTVLYARPLQALLDYQVYLPTFLQTPNIEILLQNFIEWGRKNNPEPSANLRGLVVHTTTSTEGSLSLGEAHIINLWDCAVQTLKTYGIVIQASLLTAQKQIVFTIQKQTGQAFVEADLPNILRKTITLQDNSGTANCCVIGNKDHPEQFLWFANETENNAVWVAQEITVKEGESFREKAEEQARALILPSAFDNCIELTVKEDDLLVTSHEIGTYTEVAVGGRILPAVVTAVEYANETKTITYGAIRLDLTRQLIIQRRNLK